MGFSTVLLGRNSGVMKLSFFCCSSWTELHAQCNDVLFSYKKKNNFCCNVFDSA